MRVIITGGTGLIGRALVADLIKDDHTVIVLSRSLKQAADLPAKVQITQWDGRTTTGWSHLVDGADAVINLAGEPIAEGRWTKERKQRLRQSRIEAGRAIVQAVEMAENKPEVVIQASAVGYYGPRDKQALTEESQAGTDFLAKLCLDWEASTASVKKMGVRHVIIRTGVVLSRDGGAFPRMALPFKLFAGGRLGSGKQWLPWIHLADEVAAIRFLMNHETAEGPFNLTAPNPLTNDQFGKVLGRAMGRPALLPTPGLAIRLAFGEVSTVLLKGQRAVPHRLQQLGFEFKFPTAEDALTDLLRQKYRHRFQVRAPLTEVADFHTQSKSMGDITPPPAVVQIHQAPPHLQEGAEMDFTVWLGPVPIRWLARIEDVKPNGFVDRQVCGPFEHWTHRHTFEPVDDSTTMIVDEIDFNLQSHPWWRLVGWNMKLSLPLLFAYRGWKTRRLLEANNT